MPRPHPIFVCAGSAPPPPSVVAFFIVPPDDVPNIVVTTNRISAVIVAAHHGATNFWILVLTSKACPAHRFRPLCTDDAFKTDKHAEYEKRYHTIRAEKHVRIRNRYHSGGWV